MSLFITLSPVLDDTYTVLPNAFSFNIHFNEGFYFMNFIFSQSSVFGVYWQCMCKDRVIMVKDEFCYFIFSPLLSLIKIKKCLRTAEQTRCKILLHRSFTLTLYFGFAIMFFTP